MSDRMGPVPDSGAIAGPGGRLRRFFSNSRLARSVALLAGGSAVAQLISLLAAPVSTRLYTPGDFGEVAVFNALLGLVLIFASLRYEQAIPLPGKDDSALDVLFLCLGILGCTSLLAGVLVLLGSGWISSITNSAVMLNWGWLFPVGVVGAGAYQALNYWALRRKQYRRIAQTRLSQSILGTATMLGVGALCAGPAGLLFSAVVSQTAGVLLLSADVRHASRGRMGSTAVVGLLSAAREYRQFPLFASFAAVLNSAASILPPLLLSGLYGDQVTGWFALAQKIMLLPLSLVGLAVGQVFLGEAADMARAESNVLSGLFTNVTRKMLLVAVLVLAGGACSPLIFPFLFGQRWAEAGTYAAILSVMCAAQLVVSPVSSIVIVKKRMGIQLIIDLVRAGAVFVALWLPSALGWQSTVAVAAYSLVMTSMYGVMYFIYRRMASHGGGHTVECTARPEG